MGVHDGHRERLKKRYVDYGMDSFNEVNALELLLFYAIPRRDTNEIAHKLLKHFGSLSAVFEASVQELQGVEGIGENAAILITLIPEMLKKGEISKAEKITQIMSSKDAGAYFLPRFMNLGDEVLYMLCLDNKRAVICCKEIARGVINRVDANVRTVVEMALKMKAVSVILAHNHPGGVAIPSREDSYFTKSVYTSLNLIGINLEDHLIIAGDEFVSFADSGFIQSCRF